MLIPVSVRRLPRASAAAAPAGSLAHLDFLTGDYLVGSTAYAVGELLGGGFDAGSLGARGMGVGVPAAPNYPVAIGAFHTAMLAHLASGLTLIVELDLADAVSLIGPVCWLLDHADADQITKFWALETSGTPTKVSLSDGLDVLAQSQTVTAAEVQTFGYVLSRDAGADHDYAVVGNGGTPSKDTAGYDGGNVVVVTGGIRLFGVEEWDVKPDGPWYVRRLTLYPAKSDADLSTLTG